MCDLVSRSYQHFFPGKANLPEYKRGLSDLGIHAQDFSLPPPPALALALALALSPSMGRFLAVCEN